MRPRTVHAMFAAASVVLAGLVAACALRLVQAERVDRAIARAAAPQDADAALPEARFARALALAAAGRYEPALRANKALLEGDAGPLREAALYNLGNLHLRAALQAGPDAASPLVELAKQSYRDALRAEPGDWDARYNLERALQLAPETDDQAAGDDAPEPDKELTITTAPAGRSDLP